MSPTNTEELRPSQVAATLSNEHGAGPLRLVDVGLILVRRKRVITLITTGVALVTVVITLLVRNVYEASTVMLPPQQSEGAAAAVLLGQLGPLAMLAGKDMGASTPEAVYVSILKSRTVQDDLIKKFDLVRRYDKRRWSDVRQKLTDRTLISEDRKSGVITIAVDDESPQQAADMANSYVDELHKQSLHLAITEAGRRRLFFEQEVEHEKAQLASAEENLRRTEEKTGLIQLDEQAKAIIESVARLKGQVAAKEVQLQAMRSFATEQNPDFVRTQEELIGLQAQLAKMQRSQVIGGGNIEVPTQKVPELGLEYVRSLREVKFHEMLFEALAKQLEAAKIDEAKDSSMIQVLDYAVPPDHKISPARIRIVLLTTVMGFIVACAGVVVYERFRMKGLSVGGISFLAMS